MKSVELKFLCGEEVWHVEMCAGHLDYEKTTVAAVHISVDYDRNGNSKQHVTYELNNGWRCPGHTLFATAEEASQAALDAEVEELRDRIRVIQATIDIDKGALAGLPARVEKNEKRLASMQRKLARKLNAMKEK